jgi:flagellin
MALSITTNVPSLFAQNALDKTSASLDTSLQRLSTGLKINSGADGPAAYVISQQQQAQIAGLQTAIQNTSKATDLVQTADGALGTISNLLTQIRGLALDSANSGVQDSAALAANQSQIANAIQTINNIAANTQFGTKKILDGTAGFGATSSDAVSFTGLGATSATTPGTYTVNTTGAHDTGAAQGAVGITAGSTSATAASVAIDASSTAYLKSATSLTLAETLTITGANGVVTPIALTAGELGSNVANAINAQTHTTGVVASFGGTGGGLKLTSVNGQNFSVVSNVAAGAGQTGIGTTVQHTASTSSSGDITDVAGVAGNKYVSSTQNQLQDEVLTITGSAGAANVTLAAGNTLAQDQAAINAATSKTGVIAETGTGITTLQLQSVNYGSNFTVASNIGADTGTSGFGTATTSTATTTTGGQFTVAAASSLGEQNAQKGALAVTVGTSQAGSAYLSNATNLSAAETLTIVGPDGTATVALAQGLTNTAVAQAINNFTSQTGVIADTGAANGGLRLYTQQFGQNFQVSSNVAQGNGSTGIGTAVANTGNGNSVSNANNANFVITEGQNAVVKLTDANGNHFLVTGNGGTVTGSTGEVSGLSFTLTPSGANPFVTTSVDSSNITASNGTLTFQIGANAGQTASLAINSVAAANIGIVSGNQFANLAAINVTTTAGAQASIAVVDQAINDISTESGSLGAFQTNTLQSTATNLQSTLTNTQSAESTIADTNYSAEIANFTQLQVQLQAGTSVLGIANQIPQNVLTLLQKL